jgi:hypothetical protein
MLTVEQHMRNLAAIIRSERFLHGKLESMARYLKQRCGFFGVTIIKSSGDEFDDHIYMCPGRGKTNLRAHPATPYLSADPLDCVSIIGAKQSGVRQIADHLSTRQEELIPIARGENHLGWISIELLQDQSLGHDEWKLLTHAANLLAGIMEPAVVVVGAQA